MLSQSGKQKFTQIEAGEVHTLVLLSNGELYAFGRNEFGELGLGHRNSVSTPTLVKYFKDKAIQQIVTGSGYTFVLLSNGELYAFGRGGEGQLGLGNTNHVSTPTHVKYFKDKAIHQIVAGGMGMGAFVVLSNGELYAFGSNNDGELGLGHTEIVSTPTLVKYFKGN